MQRVLFRCLPALACMVLAVPAGHAEPPVPPPPPPASADGMAPPIAQPDDAAPFFVPAPAVDAAPARRPASALQATSASQQGPRVAPPADLQGCLARFAARQYETAVHCLVALATTPDALQATALAEEQVGHLDAAGKRWQAAARHATGPLQVAMTRRINALAEAELAVSALVAGKAADAVKKLRSALVEQAAQTAVGLPATGSLALALAWAERAARHRTEASQALVQAAKSGSMTMAARAGRVLQHWDDKGAWPLAERVMGEADDEVPVALANLPGGGFAVAADVDLGLRSGHKLRLWRVDAAGRPTSVATWGGNGDDRPQAMAVTASGHVLVAGSTTSGGGEQKAWLVAFDRPGHAQFEIALPASEARAILLLPKDRVVLAGTRAVDGTTRAWLATVSAGAMETARSWGGDGCSGVALASLPGAAVAVAAQCQGSNVAITRLGLDDGPPGWTARIDGVGPVAAMLASGPGLVLAGAGLAGAKPWLARVDKAGKILNRQTLALEMTPVAMAGLPGKQWLLLGRAGTEPTPWLATLDARGKVKRSAPLAGSPDEVAVAFLSGKSDVTLLSSQAGEAGGARDVVWRRLVWR